MAYNMPRMPQYALGKTTNTYGRGVDGTTENKLISFFSDVYPKANSALPAGTLSGNLGRVKEKSTLDDMLEGMTTEISASIERAQFMSDNFFYKLLPIRKGTSHTYEWHTTIFEPKIPTPLAPRARPRLLGLRKVAGKAALTREGIGFEIDLETLHVPRGTQWYIEHLLQASVSVETGNKLSILWKILTAHVDQRVYLNDRTFVMTIGIPGLYDRARENFGHAQKHEMPLQNAMRRLGEEADKMRVPRTNIAVLAQMTTLSKLSETKPRYTEFFRAGELAMRALEMGGQAFMKMFDGAEVFGIHTFYTENGELNMMLTPTRIGLYHMAISPFATNNVTVKRNAASRDIRIMDFERRRKQPVSFKDIIIGTDRYDPVSGEVNEFTAQAAWANTDPSVRDPPTSDQFLYEGADGNNKTVKYWGQMRTDLWTLTDMMNLVGSNVLQIDAADRAKYNDALNTFFDAAIASETAMRNSTTYAVYLQALLDANPGEDAHRAGDTSWGGVAPLYNIAEITRNGQTRTLNLPDFAAIKTALTLYRTTIVNAADAAAVQQGKATTVAVAGFPAGAVDSGVFNLVVRIVLATVPAGTDAAEFAAKKTAAIAAIDAALGLDEHEFPPGFATAQGFEEIARVHKLANADNFGVKEAWRKRVAAAIEPLSLLAQRLDTECRNNLLTNTRYAPSWMYHPRPVDVFLYTLLRERPVLWLNKVTVLAAPPNARDLTTIPFVRQVIDNTNNVVAAQRSDTGAATATTLAAYTIIVDNLRALATASANQAYEVVAKQALLARFFSLAAPATEKTRAANNRKTFHALLEEAGGLAAVFPINDLTPPGPVTTLRQALDHLRNVATANARLFQTRSVDALVADLENTVNVLETNRAAVVAELRDAVAAVGSRGLAAAVAAAAFQNKFVRSSITVSPQQIKHLNELTAALGYAPAVPSDVVMFDTFIEPRQLSTLVQNIERAPTKQPLAFHEMKIRSAMDATHDFGAAHRVAVINGTVNGSQSSSSSLSAQKQARADVPSPAAFGGLVTSNPFAAQSPVNANATSATGRLLTAERPAFLGAAPGARAGGAPSYQQPAAAPSDEQVRHAVRFSAFREHLSTLNVAVADLVNSEFAERFNHIFNTASSKLVLAYALAFITTPNNYHDSLSRWLDCGYDVPYAAVCTREFYAETYTLVRMVAGSQTGGFIQGQQNTWWGYDAGRQVFGLYNTYYCAPYVERPEFIQKMDGFDLERYMYGGGTGIRTGREHALNPNGQHAFGKDLLCIALPPSVRELDAVFSPAGRLEVANRQQFINVPVVDQRFVNASFEKWRLKLDSRRNDRNYNADDIIGSTMTPSVTTVAYYEDHTEYLDPLTNHYNIYRPARGPWPSSAVEPYMRDAIDGKKSFEKIDYNGWQSI